MLMAFEIFSEKRLICKFQDMFDSRIKHKKNWVTLLINIPLISKLIYAHYFVKA